ncbi:helix-turn-helix domain-containing protein [Micrococcus luteus]|uniref:helix-turn-helix transcriptional regulator n=1 Tax=Micrococcus luteus TaxID=1270 RepID=UPI0034484E13
MTTTPTPFEFDTKTAAEYLGISESTFRRMVSRGEVKAYRIGQRAIRFRRADLDRAVKEVNPATFAAVNG